MKERKRIKEESPAESVVLDSSALLTLWNDEEGADRVAELLGSGKENLCFLYDADGVPLSDLEKRGSP